MRDAGVGDLRILQIKHLQGFELADVAQVVVMDFSAFQRKDNDVAAAGYYSRAEAFERRKYFPLFFQRPPSCSDPTQQKAIRHDDCQQRAQAKARKSPMT